MDISINFLMMNLVLALFEILCGSIFFELYLVKKKRKFYMQDILLLAVAAIFCLIYVESRIRYLAQCLLVTSIIMLYEYILYEGNFFVKLFLAIEYCGIVLGGQLLVEIMQGMKADERFLYEDMDFAFSNIYLQFALKILWLLCLFVLNKCWNKSEKRYYMEKIEDGLMLIIPAVTLAVILVLLNDYDSDRKGLFILIDIGMIFLNIFIAFYLKIAAGREQERADLIVSEERSRIQMQVFRQQQTDYESQRKMFHDYKNQIGCILGLLEEGNMGEAQEFAEKLNRTLTERAQVIDVNQPVISVLLNQKYMQASERGTTIIFQVNDLKRVWLEDQDIVIVLSNLLDNAIEACGRFVGARIIQFRMILEEEQLVISVQNPLSEAIAVQGETISTQKKDKANHGIGMKNIRDVIRKYQGMGSWSSTEDTFYYTVIFPRP